MTGPWKRCFWSPGRRDRGKREKSRGMANGREGDGGQEGGKSPE